MPSRTPTPEEQALLRVYQDAERAALDQITRETRAVVDAPDVDLTARKADGARAVRGEARRVVFALEFAARERIRRVIAAAASQGTAEAAKQLGRVKFAGSQEFDRTNRRMIDQVAGAVLDRVSPAQQAVLRGADDAFREVVSRVLPRMAVGADSRRSATQRALWALLDRGLTGFTDDAGRRWTLSSYVEMAVRTGAQRAAIGAQLNATRAAGSDLVIVNGSNDRCERCRPWHGKVLSISGARSYRVEHPYIDDQWETAEVDGTVDEATAAGLFHPQCRCSLATYTPGLTRVPPPAEDNGQYAARQRQRAIERQIRAWKSREASSLDADGAKQAKAGVRAAQARMREHLKANPDLRRKSEREQIGAGNLPDAGLRERVGPGGDPLS